MPNFIIAKLTEDNNGKADPPQAEHERVLRAR